MCAASRSPSEGNPGTSRKNLLAENSPIERISAHMRKLRIAPSARLEDGATSQKTMHFFLKKKWRRCSKGALLHLMAVPGSALGDRETGNTYIIPDTSLCG